MKLLLLSVMAILCGAFAAQGQFSTAWIQNESYWGDGKAEFNIYEADEVRYDQPRRTEVVHIFVREPFSPTELVKTENGAQRGAYPVLKLNQILHVPTGIYLYQQMHSAFWRTSDAKLIKATLTSNDSCGNTYKEIRPVTGWRSWFRSAWRYEWRTYWEAMSAGEEIVRAPNDAIFYDELPMRVRTVDFATPSGEFVLPIMPTIIHSKKGELAVSPARVSWRRLAGEANAAQPGEITVEVSRGDLRDRFTLEGIFPHRVQAWSKADGSTYRLKRSLKIDYWNYNKVGDKERALGITAPVSP